LQILTFSLVPVVLAEIHGFKWVIGCFWLVFAGLDRSSSIVRSTALGVAWSLYGRFIVVYTKLETDFIKETRAWIWRYSLWIWWCHPDCPYIFWTVSHLFFIIWTSGIDVFSSHQQINAEICETVLNTLLRFYLC